MIKTAKELAAACLNVAKNYKTLYVMGCFGAPMTESNKTKYIKHHTYNQKDARKKMINAATSDTFGFDCVNLIKGLLWGWNGNKAMTYGGAKYATNGVPDTNANGLIQRCKNVTTDFSKIEVGEVLWMEGHVGIYIGDGMAVECTPAWDNCVQVTTVRNIKAGTGHKWTKHGKLPYVTYDGSQTTTEAQKPAGDGEAANDSGAIGKDSKVAIKPTATTYYPGGPSIPAFVRDYHHIVTQTTSGGKQVKKGGKVCVLLGKKISKTSGIVASGINTWVAVDNLKKL